MPLNQQPSGDGMETEIGSGLEGPTDTNPTAQDTQSNVSNATNEALDPAVLARVAYERKMAEEDRAARGTESMMRGEGERRASEAAAKVQEEKSADAALTSL